MDNQNDQEEVQAEPEDNELDIETQQFLDRFNLPVEALALRDEL